MEGAAAATPLLQATVDNICHCSRDTQLHSLHPREQLQSSALWRPWILTARADEMTENQRTSEQDGQLRNFKSKGALGFQHPVRQPATVSVRCQEGFQNSRTFLKLPTIGTATCILHSAKKHSTTSLPWQHIIREKP
ncbi:protein ripply3 isoform X2 [Struthio camelus]|uniref:protein ripply3 isoform X2 n=1 Tax=Struthio camelus TaxID=8801 RepID=UPI00360402A5